MTTPDTPDPRQAGPPPAARDGDGKFTRSVDGAEFDAKAARLRVRGLSYREIAAELGYADHSSARDAVLRALAAVPQEAGAEARQVELDRLDRLVEKATRIMETAHLAYNNKGVVEWDGRALEDDAPALAAVTALMRLSESRRKLLGLDAEQKVAVTGDVRYEVVGMAPEDIAGGPSAG